MERERGGGEARVRVSIGRLGRNRAVGKGFMDEEEEEKECGGGGGVGGIQAKVGLLPADWLSSNHSLLRLHQAAGTATLATASG